MLVQRRYEFHHFFINPNYLHKTYYHAYLLAVINCRGDAVSLFKRHWGCSGGYVVRVPTPFGSLEQRGDANYTAPATPCRVTAVSYS